MKRSAKSLIPAIGFFLIIFGILACNLSVPSRSQIEGGVATAQAAGQQVSEFATNSAPTLDALKTRGADLATNAAPTLAAAKESAIEFATNAAPTVEALQTQAVIFATDSAPTVEAGIEIAKTAVVEGKERTDQAKATLDAAGIDGRYLWDKAKSVVPDENGNIFITFTEDELNLAMNAHLLVKKQEGELPPMENMVIQLTDGLIFLEGRIESPVAANVRLHIQPLVLENGDLALTIVSADANGYQLPQFAMNQISNLLDVTVVDAINKVPIPVTLQNVSISNHSITFIAKR